MPHREITESLTYSPLPLPPLPHPKGAIPQPDSPDVPVLLRQSHRCDQYPTASQQRFVPDHPATPYSSRVSPPRSAPIQSHAPHHGCSIEMPARHISKPHANAPRSAQTEMNQEETPPTGARRIRMKTPPDAPSHVPSARNDRVRVSNRGQRYAELPHSLPSDANCRTRDYSATPTPIPLLSSTRIEPEPTQKTWKESARSQTEPRPLHVGRSSRTAVKPGLHPASAMEAGPAALPRTDETDRADSPNPDSPAREHSD